MKGGQIAALATTCRLEINKDGKLEFIDRVESYQDLEDIDNLIFSDKKFGTMMPKNGVITWSLLNTDAEISFRAAKASMAKAFTEWALYVPVVFKYENDFNAADIQIMFKAQANDKNLNGNTIAYAYYPSSKLKAVVFNTAFLFTQHGDSMKGSEVEKLGIKVQFPNGMYETIDLDKVTRHELGHKIFGLQHDPVYWTTMASKEPVMSERVVERDILRAQAKLGKRQIVESKFRRFINWIIPASERKF